MSSPPRPPDPILPPLNTIVTNSASPAPAPAPALAPATASVSASASAPTPAPAPAPAPALTPAPAPPPAIPFPAHAANLTSFATTPTARPLSNFRPSPYLHQHQQQILHSDPIRPKFSPQGIVYPVVSSGRGFIPHRPLGPSNHAVTIASPNPSNRPVISYPSNPQLLRPTHVNPFAGLPASAHPKAVPSLNISLKSTANGFKDPRDRGKDDNLIVVRDRKVRLSDGDSLYGLGRSWLRNGLPEERMGWQPRYGDFARSLPSPLPMMVAGSLPVKEEVEEEEDKEDNVESLSAKDLLKGHIRRAKRVRLRAKEERMKRISRFRTRITLLLPSPEAEQFRNDSASGT